MKEIGELRPQEALLQFLRHFVIAKQKKSQREDHILMFKKRIFNQKFIRPEGPHLPSEGGLNFHFFCKKILYFIIALRIITLKL